MSEHMFYLLRFVFKARSESIYKLTIADDLAFNLVWSIGQGQCLVSPEMAEKCGLYLIFLRILPHTQQAGIHLLNPANE